MSRRRAASVAVALLAGAVALGATGPPAGAAGDGGASSRVTRDGRIITSILLGRPLGARGGGSGPTSYWLTLSDAELAFVVQLAAARPDLADTPTLAAIRPFLDAGTSGGFDLQLRVEGGRFTGQVRAVPSPPGTARALARRMITELPPLRARTTPPPGTPALVREPVFVSFPQADWDTVVDRSLTAGGVTARVRAWPASFRVSSGDPASAMTWRRCDGPGRPFDPGDPASPAVQSRRPDACTMTYRTATGVAGRRDRWYGDVTVVWRAEWTTDGVTWRSLGEVPRVSIFTRRVRTVATTIESPDDGTATVGPR